MNNIFTDRIIIEEPGYLGAIQAFSLYKPKFSPVQVCEHGMDLDRLKSIVSESNPKLIYSVPNFQNPSGITYTTENRKEISDIIYDKEIFLIEDDPYGDLRFSGTPKSSFKKYLPKKKTILLGPFSKTVVPG